MSDVDAAGAATAAAEAFDPAGATAAAEPAECRLGHEPSDKQMVDSWSNFNVVLPAPATTFDSPGEVVCWHWFARGSQTVGFQVWRSTTSEGTFRLIGSSEIRVEGGGGSQELSPSERIRVEAGDVLGLRLPLPATIPYTWGKGHVANWPAEGCNTAAPLVGEELRFDNNGSSNHDREYALACDWIRRRVVQLSLQEAEEGEGQSMGVKVAFTSLGGNELLVMPLEFESTTDSMLAKAEAAFPSSDFVLPDGRRLHEVDPTTPSGALFDIA